MRSQDVVIQLVVGPQEAADVHAAKNNINWKLEQRGYVPPWVKVNACSNQTLRKQRVFAEAALQSYQQGPTLARSKETSSMFVKADSSLFLALLILN